MKKILGVVALLVLLAWCGSPSSNRPVAPALTPQQQAQAKMEVEATAEKKREEKRKTYTKAQVRAAQTVMANTREIAKVWVEDNRWLVVNFNHYIGEHSKNERLSVATAIANADAVLEGESRIIYFHQPDGAMFATARPESGIQLE